MSVYILMCCRGVSQGQEKDVREDDNAKMENADASFVEEVSSPAVFVNTRRGKGNGTKRKLSDTATGTESDAKLPPRAAEVLHIITYPHHTQVHDTNHTFFMLKCHIKFAS